MSHEGNSIPSTPVDSSSSILLMAEGYDVIGIDDGVLGRVYGLKELNLPSTLNMISENLFNSCDELEVINVSEENRHMINVARSAGASAKFAGSGGAIVGTYEDEAQYALLCNKLAEIGCTTFKPTIAISDEALPSNIGNWRNS
mgnify:CR=1 FL=1